MPYIIRRHEGGTVTFWRGADQPDVWVYHTSDAAQFATADDAQFEFRKATGYNTGAGAGSYPGPSAQIVGWSTS